MNITTIVEKDETGLNQINEAVNKFEDEGLLYAISQNNLDEFTIMQNKLMVESYNKKLDMEIASLWRFANTFNTDYATTNNKCFECAHLLFNRIRQSVSCLKKVYKTLSPRINKKHPDPEKNKTSAFLKAYCLHGNYTGDLFGIDSFPQYVVDFLKTLEEFFGKIIFAIKICRQVITKEAEIRKDPNQLLIIYNKTKEKANNTTVKQMLTIINMQGFDSSKAIPVYPKITNELAKWFHNLEWEEFCSILISEIRTSALKNGLTDVEQILFGDNRELALDTRYVVQHFDELSFAKGRKDNSHGGNKINAKAIAMLQKWCMVVGKGNEVSFVEKFFHDTYQGKYSLVRNSAVQGQKSNYDSEEYEKFKQEVEKLVLKRHDFNEKDSKIVPISAIN